MSQGALGIEIKTKNCYMQELLSGLNHIPTLLRCIAERALLKTLEGGCSAPVAVDTDLEGDKVRIFLNTLNSILIQL